MAIKTSDIRYHGNQYGHRVILSGDTLLFFCDLAGVRDPENMTDQDHEAVSALFIKMLERSLMGPEAPTIVEQV